MTQYFDCFAIIGRRAGQDPEAPWSTEHLLDEMDRCHIQRALVLSHHASEIHPSMGNQWTVQECEKSDRLYPCWVAMPHHSEEFPPPETLVREMESNHVRALKIYPRKYNFPVDSFILGELFNVLQEARIPIIVDRGELGDAVQIEWREIAWICELYPHLPLLLHSVRWEATRTLISFAKRFKNLYFEFSNYQGNRMLEFWCKTIGHERLLFGTEALTKSMGAAKAYIDYSELNDDQRKAIAGGNLQTLLKLPKPLTDDSEKQSVDPILQKALSAQPISDMTVIDAHAHILQQGGQGTSVVTMHRGDAEGIIQRNARIGVNKTCVSAWTALFSDYRLGNHDTVQAIQQFPDNLIGYTVLNPNLISDWESECRYYYEECGFRGMKPYYPQMGIPYNDPGFKSWWKYGNKHHLFALMHPSADFKHEIFDLAKRFPNINFLLAHSGWTWKTARQHIDIAKSFDNCYLEITFTTVTSGIIEFMVKELSSERIVYGSDSPMRDPFPQFGWVVYADISEKDKRNILGKNMESILKQVRLPK